MSQCWWPRIRKRAGDIEGRPLASEARIDLAARKRRSSGELEGLVAGVGVDLDEPVTRWNAVIVLALELDMGEAAALSPTSTSVTAFRCNSRPPTLD